MVLYLEFRFSHNAGYCTQKLGANLDHRSDIWGEIGKLVYRSFIKVLLTEWAGDEMLGLTNLFIRALPLPIHHPSPPDSWFCHQEYGYNLVSSDCQKAVDDNWPSGKTPIHYNSIDPSPSNSVRIPKTDSYGSCTVSLESAGPDFPPPNFSMPPDHLRALAGFIIETCAGQGEGVGGYVTHGFEAAQNYIASSNNTDLEDLIDQAAGKVSHGSFLTVAISGVPNYRMQPGDTDPNIASRLSNYATNLSTHYPDPDEEDRKFHFLDEAKRLRNRALDMVRGGAVFWWWDIDLVDMSESSSNEGETEDTATSPPSNSPNNKMTYLCEADLGSPQAIDCEKLAWSGLKPPDSVETLKPETPNIYTSGSCALGISSPVATTITWAHLLAAFETINTLCVQNPLKSVKGGRAYFGTQSVDSWVNGKRDSIGGVNGSEALPLGVNATVWNHSTKNVNLDCEWQLATEGKDVSDCER